MKSIFVSCLMAVGFYLSAQVMPYDDLFFWNKENLRLHKVKSITGYEFDFTTQKISTANISSGTKQTQELYDSLGRIQSKINFYFYSDVGSRERRLAYDYKSRVDSFYLFTANELERLETYDWKKDSLKEWSIIEYTLRERPVVIRKEMTVNEKGQPIQLIKLGRKILEKNYIEFHQVDSADITVIKNIDTNEQLDSTVIYPCKEDTVFHQEVFKNNVMTFREKHWVRDSTVTSRTEEYIDGQFNCVYYKRTLGGHVIYERQIHTVPNLNYTKKYYYTVEGLPSRKEVFRNTSTPEKTIYYLIEKF